MGTVVVDDVASLGPEDRRAVAEDAEASFMWAFSAGAPPEARSALGMSRHRVGGVVVCSMAHDPTGGYWSKSLRFGVDEPVTGALVEEVLEVHRRAGDAVASLQISEDLLPDDWPDVCARLGLVRGSTWVKLLRPAALDPAPPDTDLRVGPVTPADGDPWARVFCTGFGMPEDPHLVAFFAAAADDGSAFEPWGAWDGDRLVAAANLHLTDRAAAFCGAATLPDARRRGAQTAFMSARVDRARTAGLRWCSAETWREEPDHEDPGMHHNPSLWNMRRAGFVDVYERANWVWRRPA